LEKRTFARQILDHPAGFGAVSGTAYDCIIKDFCKGGLFVTFDYHEGDILNSGISSPKLNDEIFVDFHSAKPLRLKYRLRTRIIRKLDSALGLKIDQEHPEAVHALYELAQVHSMESKKPPTKEDYTAITEEFRSKTAGFLSASTSLLVEHIIDNLMLVAGDTSSKTSTIDEADLFDVLAGVSRSREQITDSMNKAVLAQIDNWIEGKPVVLPDGSSDVIEDGLSLISTDDFEDWLSVKVIIARADQRFRDELFDVQLRMSEISPLPVNEKNNPISPTSFSHAFYRAIQPLNLTHELCELIFSQYEEQFIPRLDSLYSALNELMIKSEILPEISYRAIKSELSDVEKAQLKAREKVAADLLNNHVVASTIKAINPTPEIATPKAAEGNRAQFIDVNLGDAARLEAQLDAQQNTNRATQAYATARSLLNLGEQLHASIEHSGGDVAATQVNYIEPELLQNNLSHLQSLVITEELNDASVRLKERIEVHLESTSHSLTSEDSETVEITENFFHSMTDNQALGERIKPVLKRLEIPLLKILLQDDGFFEKEQHPARQVLNRLAKLGLSGTALSKAAEENILRLTERIVVEFDQDTQIFSDVLVDLEQLSNKQEATAERNTERVIQSCEGLQTIENAKKTVTESIEKHMGGRWVPRVLVDLLDHGWRELMVFTLLRDGKDSAIWRSYIQVLRQLSKLNPKGTHAPDVLKMGAGLYKIIETGVQDSPANTTQMRKLLPALSYLLMPREDSPEPEFIEFERNQTPPDAAFMAIDEVSVQDRALARWMKRAQRLKVGDWLEFRSNDRLQIRLAWAAEDHQKTVFVNHQGMKVIEFSLKELGEQLQGGNAVFINDPDQPFVDASLDQMVQSMYERMNFQATHEEVTGLINRKEFERHVKHALYKAKRNQIDYLLFQIDLDEFKVINNACGHEAGNLFLQGISQLFINNNDNEALIGHFGADEFAILIPGNPSNSAGKIANSYLELVHDFRFSWENKLHTVGASIGVANITAASRSVSSVMGDLESAKLSAKEAGGNRIYIYEEGDVTEAHRSEVMEKMTSLIQALDEERLSLRCQKIVPLSPRAGKPRYEILLSIQDEEGNELATSDFIHAAERFNRMHSVDRWVIHHAFSWLSEYGNKLDHLEGCAINLSAHSLNDDTLLAFIFEELINCNIPRDKICFELSETAAITNLADVADFIGEMKSVGFQFALDDFGAGFSSYKFLKHLPVDYLKIDGSFIENIASDDNDFAMVKSIHEMAKLIGVQTVAEQVVDGDVLTRLREIGIDYAQGNGVGKPMSLEAMLNQAAA